MVSLYVLKLQHRCWYVGISANPERRIKQHFRGKGASFTKKHLPVECVHTEPFTTRYKAEYAEYRVARKMRALYGKDLVKGAGWC